MLALVTYMFIYHCYGKSVLYRIRRGLCSIIVTRVFVDTYKVIIDN